MNIIDMKSIIFNYLISNTLCTGVVTLLWLQNRRRFAGLDLWLACFAAQTVYMPLVILRGIVPDWLSMIANNVLLVGGALLLYIGLEHFVDQRGTQTHNYVLLAIFTVVQSYFVFARFNLAAREINISVGLLVICFQGAWLMLRRTSTDMRPITKGVGLTFVAYGLVSVTRIIVGVVVPPGHDFFKESGLFDTLLILAYQMLFIALTFGLSLMINRRLLVDLEHDLAAHQHMDEALRASEEKFAKAFQASPEAIIISRLSDGKLIEVNESFCRLSEYSREEALGNSTLALGIWISPQDRERYRATLQANHSIHNREYEFRTKSGKSLNCLYSGEVIRLGDEAHVLSVVSDITARKQAEDALRFTQSVVDRMSDAAFWATADGRIVYINEAACERLGYTREELLGMQATDIDVDFDIEHWPATWSEIKQKGTLTIKSRHKKKDGTVFPVEVRIDFLQFKGKEYACGIARDITARQQTEEVLRLRLQLFDFSVTHSLEELMQKALDEIGELTGSSIGFYHFVEEDQKTLTLQAWSTRTQKEFCKAEGQGLHYGIDKAGVWVDCVHQRKPVIHNDYVSLPHRKGMPPGHAAVTRELVVPTIRDGRIVSILGIGNKVTDYDEKDIELVAYVAGVIWSIIERKRTEEQLQNYQRQLEAQNLELRKLSLAIEQSGNAILITDTDGTIQYVNPRFEQTTGYSRQEALGKNPRILKSGEQDTVYYQNLWGTITQGHIWHGEFHNRRKDGALYWESTTVAPVQDDAGQITHYIAIKDDITARKEAEEALREKTEELDRFFSLALDLLCIADVEGYFHRLNQAWEKTLGYSLADMEGHRFLDFVHPDDVPATLATMGELDAGQEILNFVNRYRCKDGSYRWIEWRSAPYGSLIYAAARDITERKQAEEAIRRSEEDFRLLFETNPFPILITRAVDGSIIQANQALLDYMEADRDDLISAHAPEYYTHPTDRQALLDSIKVTGKVVHQTVELKTKQDRTKFALINVLPLEYAGEACLLVGMADITELEQTQAALQESESRMRQITAAMRQAVWLRDTQTLEVLYVNPAYEEIWGRTCASLITDPTSFIQAIHPDDLPRIMAAIQQQYQGIFFNQEYRIFRPDGDLRWVWGRTFPIENDAGEVYRVLAVVEDITERKQMADVLRQAKENAETANRAKSVFLANMSHELRTPLNAVLGFSGLMARDPNLSQTQRENLDIIERSGEHLLALINDVLDLSKIEAGRMDVQPEVFDIHQMLLGLGEMFRLRADRKGLTMVFDFASEVPQYIYTDQGKLRQVLINLLGNAVKFTKTGGITMRVEASSVENGESRTENQGDTLHSPASILLHFEVKDTGAGIAADEMDKVFEAFAQTESGQQSRQGTGLGLPISREYVHMMGGDLTVQSEVRAGTTFSFDIQAEVMDAAEIEPAQSAHHVIGLEPGQPTYRILIAEDDEASRLLLTKLLAPLGFEIQEAVDGEETLAIWESWHPHLIFMDMRMPKMDGHEATRDIKSRIKNQDSLIKTVIIAVTASAFEEERENILAEGCDDFVRKPFREATLFEILNRHLGARFIYEKSPQRAEIQTGETVGADLSNQTQNLSSKWVRDMQQATLEGDLEWMERLIVQIQDTVPDLAKQLLKLVYNFEHETILTLIAQNPGGNS